MSVAGQHIHLSTGIDLYYEIAGQGAPAFVFLHGGGGWSVHWQLQWPVCAAFTQVLACDLRGHGRSAAPRGRYAIETFVDDLHALLMHLAIQRPIIVGHSLGGTIGKNNISRSISNGRRPTFRHPLFEHIRNENSILSLIVFKNSTDRTSRCTHRGI